jgi:hypothetical protein
MLLGGRAVRGDRGRPGRTNLYQYSDIAAYRNNLQARALGSRPSRPQLGPSARETAGRDGLPLGLKA